VIWCAWKRVNDLANPSPAAEFGPTQLRKAKLRVRDPMLAARNAQLFRHFAANDMAAIVEPPI
jgi:hypothetical protein